jgi:hypothetical protein
VPNDNEALAKDSHRARTRSVLAGERNRHNVPPTAGEPDAPQREQRAKERRRREVPTPHGNVNARAIRHHRAQMGQLATAILQPDNNNNNKKEWLVSGELPKYISQTNKNRNTQKQ